jgi:biopolymer transport protein ExbB
MGGPMMVPILFVSVFALALVAAKLKQFSLMRAGAQNFLKNIFELLGRQRLKEAIDLCDKANTPLVRVIKSGIMKYDRPKDDIRESMQESFLYELPVLEEGISILSTIVQIAPLLGFLGTAAGLISLFGVLQAKVAASLPVVLSDLTPAVWQTLICPVAGFVVSIPTLIALNYFEARIKSFTEEVERAATELLAFFMERRMPL